MSEKLDIYDRNRHKTNRTVFRDEDVLLNDNEFIVALRAWVVNNENKILFTRRSMSKTQPGKWEPTGCLLTSGESSLEGIKRELKEEIGLSVNDDEITLLETLVETEEHEKVNIFRDIYLVRKNITEKDLFFSDNEVIDAKFITIEEMIETIDNGESFEWLRSFEITYNKIFKR